MTNTTVYPFGTGGQLPSSIGVINDLTTGGADKALSAQQGVVIRDLITSHPAISGVWLAGSINASHAYSSTVSGRIITALPTQYPISFSVTSGYYAIVHFYSKKYIGASEISSGSYYISQEEHGWQDGDVEITPPTNCKTIVVIVKHGSAGTDAISPSDGTTAISDLVVDIPILDVVSSQTDEIAELEHNYGNTLFLGALVQKALSADALSDSTERVSTLSKMVVPRENATLTFKLPTPYCCGIRSGQTPDNLSHNNYWYYNGDTFTFPVNDIYFRLCFGKIGKYDSGTYIKIDDITVAEVQALINSGDIEILVDTDKVDVVGRNSESEKYVKACMRPFVSGFANNGGLNKLPVFAHTSDTHGDANRFKAFADYCDYLSVDAALVSGDMVALKPADSNEYINDIADASTTMILPCMGNHDARGLSTDEAQNALLSHLIAKYSVSTNSQVTYPTYFYKDIAAKSIRIISLNIYENSHTSDNCHFSQEQCEWFVSSLASTPANYGVMVMFHAPEAKPDKDNSHPAFYQDILNYTGYQSGLSGNVFRAIIDTFVEKGSATITYTSKNTSISVSADFTGVANGVEFIAFVNGHLHADIIGYVADARNLQLNLNVCTGNAAYGPTSYTGNANLSDLPRGCTGSTQDCFNIYVIDRATKTVRIARVGSNITGNLTERKYMVIPYAD